jgi:hypothetical protein
MKNENGLNTQGGRFGQSVFLETNIDNDMINEAKQLESTINLIIGKMRVLIKNPYSRLGTLKGYSYSIDIKPIITKYYGKFIPLFKNLFINFYNVMINIDKEKNTENLTSKYNKFIVLIDSFNTQLETIFNDQSQFQVTNPMNNIKQNSQQNSQQNNQQYQQNPEYQNPEYQNQEDENPDNDDNKVGGKKRSQTHRYQKLNNKKSRKQSRRRH